MIRKEYLLTIVLALSVICIGCLKNGTNNNPPQVSGLGEVVTPSPSKIPTIKDIITTTTTNTIPAGGDYYYIKVTAKPDRTQKFQKRIVSIRAYGFGSNMFSMLKDPPAQY